MAVHNNTTTTYCMVYSINTVLVTRVEIYLYRYICERAPCICNLAEALICVVCSQIYQIVCPAGVDTKYIFT